MGVGVGLGTGSGSGTGVGVTLGEGLGEGVGVAVGVSWDLYSGDRAAMFAEERHDIPRTPSIINTISGTATARRMIAPPLFQ